MAGGVDRFGFFALPDGVAPHNDAWRNSAVFLVLSIAMLCAGLMAGYTARMFEGGNSSPADFFVARRKLGVFSGAVSIVASLTSAGQINGTAESMDRYGLVWTVGPITAALSLACIGVWVGPRLRRGRYMTVLDPLQERLGAGAGALLLLPSLFAYIVWFAAILNALGTTVSVVLGQSRALSTAVTLCVVLGYTLVGGLHVVTVTDIYQMGLWALSMAVLLPCALASPATASIWERALGEDGWVGGWTARVAHAPISCLLTDGSLDTLNTCGFVGACELTCRGEAVDSYGNLTGQWLDRVATALCAWSFSQVYAQSALAAEDERTARTMTLVAAGLQVIACLLCYLLGAIGASTDWAAIGAEADDVCTGLPSLAVACVFRFMLPAPVRWLSVIGYVAAMMSSLDSCVLACSSLLTWNGFWAGTGRVAFRDLSEADRVSLRATLARVTRATMLLCAACGIALALQSVEVDLLVYVAEDILFTLCTPPIAMVLCWKGTNAYGTSVALALALALRCASGEPRLNVEAALRWPYFSPLVPLGPAPSQSGQLFPFRTMIVVLACFVSTAVSALSNALFFCGAVPARWDALGILGQPALREWARARGLQSDNTLPELTRRRTHEVLDFDDECGERAAGRNLGRPKASTPTGRTAGVARAASASAPLAPSGKSAIDAPLPPPSRGPPLHVRLALGDAARAEGQTSRRSATQRADGIAPTLLRTPSATTVDILPVGHSASLEPT